VIVCNYIYQKIKEKTIKDLYGWIRGKETERIYNMSSDFYIIRQKKSAANRTPLYDMLIGNTAIYILYVAVIKNFNEMQ